MKLTEYEVSFTGNDSEVVRIDIDRWGKFSATLPRRISNELEIPETISAESLAGIRERLNMFRDRYINHIDPPVRVLIYSLAHADYSGSSNRDKINSNGQVIFRWAFAIKKCQDFYLCGNDFGEINPRRMESDRNRFDYVIYTPENLEKFRKIEEGIATIRRMIHSIADSGFVSEFDKLLTTASEVSSSEVLGE